MIANTQMLQRAGVRAPAAPITWGQLTQMMQRLRSTNAVPGGAPACLSLDWARILPHIYQNGGAWVNPARTRSVINSPQNRVTLNTYLGWLRSGLGQTPAQLGVGWCGEAIGKEKAAIVFEGNWIYGYLQKDFPNVRFAVYPMVRTAKGRGNLGFTVSYSMGKDSQNKKAAWQLLRFLVGKQGQSVWVKNSGYLPGRNDVTAPPGRANFLREAPFSEPRQFARASSACPTSPGRSSRRPSTATSRSHRCWRRSPRDAGRDRQKPTGVRFRRPRASARGRRTPGSSRRARWRSRRDGRSDSRALGARGSARRGSVRLRARSSRRPRALRALSDGVRLYVSAHEWGGIEDLLGYVAFENYRELWHDQVFWTWPPERATAPGNTVYDVVSVSPCR